MDVGETLISACERELFEETGLRVHVGPVVDVVDRIHRTDDRIEYHYVVVDYLCMVEPKAAESLAHGSDAADVRWVEVSDLAAYGVTPLAISVVRKAMALRGAQ